MSNPGPPVPRTVTILTPEICLLRPVPDVTMDPLLSQQDGSYLSVVYVQTLKAGECQLQVAVPSLALSRCTSSPSRRRSRAERPQESVR